MTALENLSSLAEGHRPENDGLLGSARYQCNGVEHVGEEEILADFRQHPFALDGVGLDLSVTRSAALIAEDRALFADLHGGRIMRAWRVGGGHSPSRDLLPRVDVAFDNDLHQSRREWLAFRNEDHPDLSPALAQPLLDLGDALLSDLRKEVLRTRGFVVRAFSDGDRAAALLSVSILARDPERRPSSRFAVIGLSGGSKAYSVIDPVAESDWSPRL
ncbi:MAG: hypothetical protein AAF311_10825 [Pseudomonadota bacterium]